MIETVKITTNNEISVIQLPNWSLNERQKILDTECIEIVKTQRIFDLFQDSYVMIIDELGHEKDLPINTVASYLYGSDMHEEFIVGDIILGVLRGTETLPLTDATNVKNFLIKRFPILRDSNVAGK